MTHQKRCKIPGIPTDLTVEEVIKDRNGRERTVDKLITDKKNCRMLGLNIQNNLTWEAHLSTGVKSLLPAVRKRLGMLSRLRDNISKKGKLQLVNCLVMSKIAYGISIWGHSTEKYTKLAQIVQNIGARLITGRGRRTRQSELMTECGWMNIIEWTQYHSVLQMWKIVWWDTPSYMRNKITIDNEKRLMTDDTKITVSRKNIQI